MTKDMTLTLKITETEVFQAILKYLSELDSNNPDLQIAENILRIAQEHATCSDSDSISLKNVINIERL